MVKKKVETRSQALVSERMTWLVWGVLAVLVVLLVSAFSKAWSANQVLRSEIEALEPVADAAMAEQLALEEQLVYVKSDEYVEAWSQTQAGMTRSGETLVRPVVVRHAPAPTPQGIAVPVSPSPPESFWTTLWRALVGD